MPAISGPSIYINGMFGDHLKSLGFIETVLKIGGYEITKKVAVLPAAPWFNMIIGSDLIGGIAFEELGQFTLTLSKYEPLPNEEHFICAFTTNEVYAELEANLQHIRDTKIRQRVKALMSNYAPRGQAFFDEEMMNIRVADTHPVMQPPKHLTRAQRDAVREQVAVLLKNGTIRPSRSAYASPVQSVLLKNGERQLCIDYRALNKKIVKDRFPLPFIEDIVESCAEAVVFTTLKLKDGFSHMAVNESSAMYTAFVTDDGHYEFQKVPWGLCTGPAVYQRYLYSVFRDLVYERVVSIYMGELLIPSTSEQDALHKLERVLKMAAYHGLQLRMDQCHFLKRKVTFLGHDLENGTVRPPADKVATVRDYPLPCNAQMVAAFLGRVGYLRKYVPDFARIAMPLSELCKKDVPFHFGVKQENAFYALQNEICEEDPVLRIYNPKRETELHTRASTNWFSASLMQKHNGHWHAVHHMSGKTSSAQRGYHPNEREVLAIIMGLQKYRSNLLDLQFRVVTNRTAVSKTMARADSCARIALWSEELSMYDCDIVQR